MGKHCDDVLLLRSLDAELTPEEAREVEAHLARCRQCRDRRIEVQHQIAGVTACFDQAEFPGHWTRRGLHRLRRQLPEPPPPAMPVRNLRYATAILAAGMLAAGVQWIRRAEPEPPPARQTIRKEPQPAVPQPPLRTARAMPPPPVAPPVLQPQPVIGKPVTNPRLPLLHVEVLYALHAASADLGEPIAIHRHRDVVRVEGIVDTRARLHQLRAALDDLHAGSLLDIQLAAAEDTPPLPPTQPTLTIAAPDTQPAIEPLLESWGMRFPAPLAHSAVAVSSTALDHAWALRRLQEAIPVTSDLPAAGRWLLRDIRADHEQQIRARAQSLQSLLDPILRHVTASPAPSLAAFERTALLRELVHSLFAGRQAPAAYPTPEAMLPMLKQLLSDAATSPRVLPCEQECEPSPH